MPSTALKSDPVPAALQSSGLTDADLAPARALAARGEDMAASQAYLALLARDPTHFQCLTELAGLAYSGGFRSAARTAYDQAVHHHPGEAIGHVNLANVLAASDEPDAAKWHFHAALKLVPDFAPAHQGLARLLAEEGDPQADDHREKGFQTQPVVRRPYRGIGTAPSVLLLVSARGGNIPTDGWLNDRHYDVTAIYAEYVDPTSDLPAHELVFNAIGDADLCGQALVRATEICARTDKPILNRPENVRPTSRVQTSGRLGAIPGLRIPAIRVATSSAIRAMDNLAFPLLIRRPGYHTGQHFHKIDTRADLRAVLDELERLGTGDLLLIGYIDARGTDGLARKYRVMFIDGALYPVHLAISTSWKVHYFTAAMADAPHHRAEEQRFLADFRGVLGERAVAALEAIAATLKLDYAGIDFTLGHDGEIILFEANATMVLIPPGPDPMWDYRRSAITTALDAVNRMLADRVAQTA